MISDTLHSLIRPGKKHPKLISNLGMPLLPVIYGEVGQWGPHSIHCFGILFAVTLAINRGKFENMGGFSCQWTTGSQNKVSRYISPVHAKQSVNSYKNLVTALTTLTCLFHPIPQLVCFLPGVPATRFLLIIDVRIFNLYDQCIMLELRCFFNRNAHIWSCSLLFGNANSQFVLKGIYILNLLFQPSFFDTPSYTPEILANWVTV